MNPIDVAHAALLEADRPDLAERIIGFDDGDGFYIEIDIDETEQIDWAAVDQAEVLARRSVGLPPLDRSMWPAGG